MGPERGEQESCSKQRYARRVLGHVSIHAAL